MTQHPSSSPHPLVPALSPESWTAWIARLRTQPSRYALRACLASRLGARPLRSSGPEALDPLES